MSKITRRLFLMAGSAVAVVAQSRFAQVRWENRIVPLAQMFFFDNQGNTLVDGQGNKLTTADLSYRTNRKIEASYSEHRSVD